MFKLQRSLPVASRFAARSYACVFDLRGDSTCPKVSGYRSPPTSRTGVETDKVISNAVAVPEMTGNCRVRRVQNVLAVDTPCQVRSAHAKRTRSTPRRTQRRIFPSRRLARTQPERGACQGLAPSRPLCSVADTCPEPYRREARHVAGGAAEEGRRAGQQGQALIRSNMAGLHCRRCISIDACQLGWLFCQNGGASIDLWRPSATAGYACCAGGMIRKLWRLRFKLQIRSVLPVAGEGGSGRGQPRGGEVMRMRRTRVGWRNIR
jgi:hypothetical protein